LTVLAVCKDLFFTSRIGETGKLVGTAVEFVRQPSELPQKLGHSRYELVIVDLTTPGWDYEALFNALEAGEPRPPVLGFTTHVLAKTTQPWHPRCARVVTKETLTQELSGILTHGLPARSRG
jgi:DNA-binding NtrC family response regulator